MINEGTEKKGGVNPVPTSERPPPPPPQPPSKAEQERSRSLIITAAERLGWKLSPDTDRFGNRFYERNGQWRRAGDFPKTHEPLPAYDSSLDAVAELESTFTTLEEISLYRDNLFRAVGLNPHYYHGDHIPSVEFFRLVTAKPAQRLQACLCTIMTLKG